MDYSMPGFPVLYYCSEFAQTYVHWVSNAIQQSHPLSPSCPPALNLSQYQGLFQWVGSSHQVAKVLFFFLCSFFEYDQFLIHIFFCCLYPFELFNLWIVIFFHSYRCLIIFNVTVFCYNFLLFLDWAGWFCVFNSWKVFIFILCFLTVTCMSSEFFFIFLVHVYFCCIFLDHWSHVTCFLFCFCSEMQSV